MSIVNSEILEDRAQVDGRRHVRERHTDHLGQTYEVSYMAEAGADVAATMAARVPILEAQLAELELAANESEVLV